MTCWELIRQLEPLVGCILQDIQAPDLVPRQAAPYCGRRIVAVEYLPPVLRDRPEQTVWLRLELPVFPDEGLGLPLVPAAVASLRWYRLNHPGNRVHPWKVKLETGNGNGDSIQLMTAPPEGRERYKRVDLPGVRYQTPPLQPWLAGLEAA